MLHRRMGNNNRLRNGIVALLGFSLAGWPRGLGAAQPPEERISQPGRYQGYSRVRFDGWRRSSRYLTMRDGVRIAIDVLRPTRSNVLHEERLPVIWEHRRYLRAVLNPSGKIYSQLDRQDHPMRKLVQHGYICAVADGRGSGVSFGARIDPNPPQESLAAYDITEWLATQPWCNGRVGMYGISRDRPAAPEGDLPRDGHVRPAAHRQALCRRPSHPDRYHLCRQRQLPDAATEPGTEPHGVSRRPAPLRRDPARG
ncbi:MAG: CocE/NonD family hydrolase [Planctomycetes bacterium]|nr:CocE/NonD family hydrolase [Planctomycetota bacterium]